MPDRKPQLYLLYQRQQTATDSVGQQQFQADRLGLQRSAEAVEGVVGTGKNREKFMKEHKDIREDEIRVIGGDCPAQTASAEMADCGPLCRCGSVRIAFAVPYSAGQRAAVLFRGGRYSVRRREIPADRFFVG